MLQDEGENQPSLLARGAGKAHAREVKHQEESDGTDDAQGHLGADCDGRGSEWRRGQKQRKTSGGKQGG
jgi:hypothetical protein